MSRYGEAIAGLSRLAAIDIEVLSRQFADGVIARERLAVVLPRLAGVYGSAAATLAAEHYDDLRIASRATGRYRAVPAELPDRGRTDSLAGWAVSPMFKDHYDDPVAATVSRASTGMQTIIAGAGRDTITASSIADPQARGWTREAEPKACDFCVSLTGIVFTERSADFEAHGGCHCEAVPIW